MIILTPGAFKSNEGEIRNKHVAQFTSIKMK